MCIHWKSTLLCFCSKVSSVWFTRFYLLLLALSPNTTQYFLTFSIHPQQYPFNSSHPKRKYGFCKSGCICYKFKFLVVYWMCVCISWVAIHSWRIAMEGSSESGWQRSDNSSRDLISFPDLDRNPPSPRFNFGTSLRPSGDNTSSDFEFRPGRKVRDRISLTQSNQFQPYTEDGVSVDPMVRGLDYGGDVSLRQWLDNPERTVDALECLHIFTQIVGIVNLAHDQGIVVHNVRPSCFVMSSFNRVSFIESASCSDSGSDSCEEGTNSQTGDFKGLSSPMHQDSQQVTVSLNLDMMNSTSASKAVTDPSRMHLRSANAMVESEASDANQKEEKHNSFPMKRILIMETNWYTSPEEVSGASGSCFSDIYRLGVLLFELFCTFSSTDEKSSTMSSLRHRVLPPQLLLKWPKEAAFCLWLLHPDPNSRPKLPELLQSDFLNEPRESLVDREAEIELRESIEEQELLLEFLLLIKQKKQEAANQFNEMVNFLASDIDEVSKLHGAHRTKVAPSLKSGNDSGSSLPSANTADEGDLCSSGSRKRGRPGLNSFQSGEFDIQKSVGPDENHGSALSKSSRLMKNFKRLESAYFLSRRRALKPSGKSSVRSSQVSSGPRGSFALTDRSSVSNFSSKEQSNEDRQSGWVSSFLGGLCQYLSFSKLDVKADLKQGDLLHSSNLVCSLGFDRDGEFFATAGVNKKIKVFEYKSILDKDSDIHYPVVEMASRSKLSSICWNSYIKSQIASSNFEGVVQVWDVTRSQMFMEMREHEKRVWSVDYSAADPTLLASGSDDGSVKLWNINQGASVLNIKTKANVCCVQFPLESNRCLAFGSADHKIYYYDLRNCKMPLCTLVGHNKTVSYIKFIDSTTVVSSSTDNTLKLWDLSMSSSRVLDSPLQSFTGHLNVKNFVGLSVSDGYIATGSETNEVFVYHKALPMPALSYKFNNTDPHSGDEVIDSSQFISSVCWRGQSTTLVAANSMGNIKLLEMI